MQRLLAARFPHWADLPVSRIEPGGWDNRSFRLGADMLVRLPSAARYAAQVEKEQAWLPRLQPLLPLSIPQPLAMGEPAAGYPWHWSIYRWLPGETLAADRITDMNALAEDLAHFLRELQRIDPTGGPAPGPHNFHRGGRLGIYDPEVRRALASLQGRINRQAIAGVWEAACDSQWQAGPVWLHGDLCADNLLVDDEQLCAVLDFGNLGVGDPACDLSIAWTLFDEPARARFRSAMQLDEATWQRARGWTLWKALITWVRHLSADQQQVERARRTIHVLLSDSDSEAVHDDF